MIITNTVNTDLWIRERTQEIYAVQGDSCTRKITVKLFANREPWTPGVDASVVIRYHKPDGTGGSYDTLPDGEKAWELSDNAVSFILAPQMLAVPGRVAVQIEMLWENGVLAAFPLHVLVEENVAADMTSSGNYFSWEQRLEQELFKTLEKAKQSGEFTGATPQLQIGTVSTLNAGEMATAAIHGTPEYPVLDLALPRGADAAVDTTLAVSGSAADAAAVGAALEGKAPAGYGLGEEYPRDIDGNNTNNALRTGWYWISLSVANTPTSAWKGVMHVVAREPSTTAQIIYYFADDRTYVVMRNINNGTPGAWEWFNPPMTSGEEYRTLERWNGKPVYTKLIDYGNVGAGYSSLSTGCGSRIVRSAVTHGGGVVPFDGVGAINNSYSTAVGVDNNNLHFYAGSNVGTANLSAQLWYIKD